VFNACAASVVEIVLSISLSIVLLDCARWAVPNHYLVDPADAVALRRCTESPCSKGGEPSPTPVEALIPGVQGRVLGVLARTETEMTVRAAAGLAGESPQQASAVVAHLVDLGIVVRRKTGSSARVSLERENEAVRIVLTLALRQERMCLLYGRGCWCRQSPICLDTGQ
jgi:hypothetical protein